MRLARRRARGARGLLLAAVGATVVATVALTTLTGYHRDVVASGVRGVLAAASAEERSILVRGAAGGTPAALAGRDRALRDGAADVLAGWPGTVEAAGYAAGRQLRGDVGAATTDDDGVVYASVMFLDDLAAHADLTAGTWPAAGDSRVQATLAEPAAATLGVGVGDRVPVTDGFTGGVTDVTVVGLWRPRAADDPYWRLAPGTATGAQADSATYGPLTVHRDDFVRHFLTNASAGWLITPDVDAATGTADLDRLADAVDAATARLPAAAGLGDSGTATSALGDLVGRIQRAALVGRSALVTPMLLVAVLGGYTLLLVAALLTEQRRAETALLRARGAARWQVAGLAGREAALVVAPAVLLAPPLATELLRHAGRIPALAEVSLRLQPRLDALTWGAALLVATGCALAMLGPNLRRGDSYIADLTARSRPGRRGVVQRAGVDVVLVVVALLGWYQLRSYSSPLSGAGGDLAIDPLLAAAPTIGVLAGAVVALRILPPLTRLAERYVDRTRATAAMLGMWQAGRRPHAGPVLLVALAVAVSALAWSLAGTTGRSLTDQADHLVGADLRLTGTGGGTPDGRAGQLTRLPGVTDVLPVWRAPLSLGATGQPASLVAADATTAARVVRLRPDLADGSPTRVFDRVAGERVEAPGTVLPAGARRLTGRFTGTVTTTDTSGQVSAHAVFTAPGGGHRRVPLGVSVGGRPVDFTVDLGAGAARLAGFTVETTGPANLVVDWRLTDLRADGHPVDLGGGPWRTVDHGGVPRDGATATATGGTITARWVRADDTRRGRGSPPVHLAVTRAAVGPVPLLATPQALAALRLDVGDATRLFLGAAEVDVRIVATVDAFPGDTADATVFADLPSLADRIFHDRGLVRDPQEWWLSVPARQHDQAVDAAAELTGLDLLDRRAVARDLAGDPFGVGARGALFAAALGAVLLAGVGVAVDVSATVGRRAAELAVLRALGAPHRTVTRSLVTEQAFLAGTGVAVGLAVGVAVAATTAPLVILTPSAQRPTPTPTLLIDWPPLLATAVAVLLLAVTATTVAAGRLRGHTEADHLRGGQDR